MKTKHTSGEWKMQPCTEGAEIYSEGLAIARIPLTHFSPLIDEQKANAKLIAAAPAMLKQLILTYLRLNIEAIQDKSALIAVKTDHIRAILLCEIAKTTGIESESIQNEIESIAFEFINGEITYQQAIEKATE